MLNQASKLIQIIATEKISESRFCERVKAFRKLEYMMDCRGSKAAKHKESNFQKNSYRIKVEFPCKV